MIGDSLYWKEDYSTGIKEIDKQHKELLRFINEMLVQCTGDPETEKTCFDSLLGEGIQSLENHFLTEEKRMKRKKYSDYAEHKQKHDRMLGDLKEIIAEIQSGKRKLELITIAVYIREWFLKHIKEMDLPMAGYIK